MNRDYLVRKIGKKDSCVEHNEKNPRRINTSSGSYSETTPEPQKKYKRKKPIYIKYKYVDNYELSKKLKRKSKHEIAEDLKKCE